jgi:fumarylacetoacetate (FAA) hydrolase family protein
MLNALPEDWEAALLVGRIEFEAGPTPVLVRGGRVFDVSGAAPTVSELLNRFESAAAMPAGVDAGTLEDLGLRPAWEGARTPRLLAPIDLQCIKAAGVTFAVSALERVIEERARGDSSRAQTIRAALCERVGADLSAVKPGSQRAHELKQALIADGLWSQYLEVAIGHDAEVFTKSPILSSVTWGDYVGVRSDSAWNNPEPEIVIVCDGRGRPRGATLGNDVNLRDFEGRSALLLGKAKDNNASCAVGPFIRLFGVGQASSLSSVIPALNESGSPSSLSSEIRNRIESGPRSSSSSDVRAPSESVLPSSVPKASGPFRPFTMDDIRSAVVNLEIDGDDGFRLEGRSSMSEISRDPLELIEQSVGKHHQYPDGFVLFLGTMFAPIQDRDTPGGGFTHKTGDRVRVSTPKLGVLENRVAACDAAPPWDFGVAALMRNLAARGLLK